MTAKRRRVVTASSRLRCLPYWMRHARTSSADTNSNDTVVTADTGLLDGTNRDTVSGRDGFMPSVGMSHCECGVELAAICPRAHEVQASDSRCVSSRSSRLASSVPSCMKGSDGRKPIASETSGRLSESNSSEGHSSTGRESIHHRLHCSDGGGCCPCTTHSTGDTVGVLSGQAERYHSPCLRVSSASSHIDRPWVCMCVYIGFRSLMHG